MPRVASTRPLSQYCQAWRTKIRAKKRCALEHGVWSFSPKKEGVACGDALRKPIELGLGLFGDLLLTIGHRGLAREAHAALFVDAETLDPDLVA